MGYGGYILKWIGDKLTAIGNWLQEAGYKVTHDPLWMAVAIGVVLLIVVLVILKRRARRD